MKTNKELYKETFENIVPSDEFKEKLLNTNATNKISNKKSKKFTTLLVAVLLIVTSTVSVCAVSKLYNMYIEKNGKYSEKLILDKNTLELEKSSEIDHYEYIKVKFDYLPNNFTSVNESKYSFSDTYAMGGLSLILYDVSDCDKIIADNTDVIDSELTTINGNDLLYIQKQIYKDYTKEHPEIDKCFYMYFADFDYMLNGYVGTDISKEELYKILASVTLSEGTKNDCFPIVCKWSDDIIEDNSHYYNFSEYNNAYSEKYNRFFEIGDTIYLEDENHIELTVNSVEISDNLSMMNEDFKKKYLDEDGKIKPLEVTCYGGGDGINSLSTIQEIKKYDLKYVYETVTLKNTSNTDINDYCIYHSIVNKSGLSMLNKIENLYNQYDNISYDENHSYSLTEWIYDDFSNENTNNPNYIDISANSETTVHIGYFILADSIDNNLCINVCQGFSDFDLNSGGFINKGNTLVNF
ncbi:MAG: hypothetical protein UHY68_04795 [Acutalibacteraceae bacterium]|nr:hypothetical protein [Acutalibacteraceae bacterium]